MPEIIYHVASSLDGFIADKNSKVDWLNDFSDDEVMSEFMELHKSFDGILLGGSTYDFALSHGQWFSKDTPSWVFTSRELPILHPSISLTQESPVELYQRLEKKGLKRIWLMGGGVLAASFLEPGLVNTINLNIVPILLGQGIPLIGKPKIEPKLKLTKHKQYANGIVSVNYQVGSN